MNQPPKIPRPVPAPRVPVPDEVGPLLSTRTGSIVTDGSVVTFVHDTTDAAAVLLFVNRLTDETNLAASLMESDGEGRWLLSYRMADDWRASYSFIEHVGTGPAPWEQVDGQVSLRALLDRGVADAANPRQVVNRAGLVQSVVELPAAPAQPFVAGPGRPRPEKREVGGRDVWVHHGGDGAHRPLVVLFDAEVWLDRHGITESVDCAVAAGALPPLTVALVGTGAVADRWRDAGGPGGLSDFVGSVLVPWARDTFDVTTDPARTVVAGQSLGALSALWTVARHADAVGAAVAQSASLWRNDPGPELEVAGARVHLEVGLQEWVLLDDHRRLAARLDRAGCDVTLTEFNGGHDYACWRGGLIDSLALLLT